MSADFAYCLANSRAGRPAHIADRSAAPLRPEAIERSEAVAGHFGEILQGRLGAGGPVVLLTLPAPGVDALGVRASWRPAPGAPLLAVGSALARWSAGGLRAGLRRAGRSGWGGRLLVETAAPVGGGCGASTASLLAALRLGAPRLSPEEEAAMLLALEGAVDPLMLPEPGSILWASRQGRRLGVIARPPRLLVVGGHDGPGRRTDPAESDFEDVSDLVEKAACAAAAGDAAAFAAVATLSAERRQARAPKPSFAALRALGRETGALGVVVAHTGSAAGLLFAPEKVEAARRAEAALVELGLARTVRFATE